MSIDLSMIKPCNHVNGKYTISNCGVCLSTGYYMDLNIASSGQPVMMSGVNKVVQETIHLFATEEKTFSDYGYPEYGSKLNKLIGTKNMTEARLKMQVLRDLQYMNGLKSKQHQRYGNIDESELIKRIVAIKTVNESDSQSIDLSLIIGKEDQLQFFTAKKFIL